LLDKGEARKACPPPTFESGAAAEKDAPLPDEVLAELEGR
jgi:hypothetical protein